MHAIGRASLADWASARIKRLSKTSTQIVDLVWQPARSTALYLVTDQMDSKISILRKRPSITLTL